MIDQPLFRVNLPLKLERYPDHKKVYVYADHVVSVEPARLADDTNSDGVSIEDVEKVTAIRLYAMGGSLIVWGKVDDIALRVERSRMAAFEIGVASVVALVEEEVERAQGRGKAN